MSPFLLELLQVAASVANVEAIVSGLGTSKVCSDNGDVKFSCLVHVQKNGGKLMKFVR